MLIFRQRSPRSQALLRRRGWELVEINGTDRMIPKATLELKNPMTGQKWRHAVAQDQSNREVFMEPYGEAVAALLMDEDFLVRTA